jgi:hypothetical protein
MLRDLVIHGHPGAPVIALGPMLGGVTLWHVTTVGGRKSVSTIKNGVTYPVHMDLCRFALPQDCCVELYRSGTGSTISRTSFVKPKNASARLIGCNLTVSDIHDAPTPSPRVSFKQSGGRVAYRRVEGDIEDAVPPGYAFLDFEERSWDQPWFASEATIDGCFYRARYEILPADAQMLRTSALPGYAGQVRIDIDGRTVHAKRLARRWAESAVVDEDSELNL